MVGAEAILQTVGGFLVAVLMGLYMSFWPQIVWWACVSTTTVTYYIILRRRISTNTSTWPLKRWYRHHLVYRFIYGCLWCWPLICLYLEPQPQIVFVQAGVVYTFLVLLLALFNFIQGSLWASSLPVIAVVFALAVVMGNFWMAGIGLAVASGGFVLARFSQFLLGSVKRYIQLDYDREVSAQKLRETNKEQKRLSKIITRDKERLEVLAKNSTDMIALHALDGTYIYINEVVEEVLGYQPAEVIRKVPLDYIHPDDKERVLEARKTSVTQGGKVHLGEFRMRHKAGHYVWLEVYERRLPRKSGTGTRTITVARDVSKRHAAALAIAMQRQTLETSLSSIRDAVLTLDVDGKVLYANTAALALCQLDNPIGQDMAKVLPLKDESGATDFVWSAVPVNQMQIASLRHKELAYFEVSVHRLQAPDALAGVTPALNAELLKQKTLAEGYVLVLRNFTQRRQLEQQLQQRANTDPLTGTMNRAAFEERLQQVAASIKRSGGSHALAFVDLDQFKIVNDTAGHHAGDELLKLIVDTLQSSVREGDVVARLGGDEFALLLIDCLGDDARRRCQQVCDAVHAINFSWESSQYPVSASFGVAMFDQTVDSVKTLMGRADAACYVVKDQGRNGVHMWTEDNVDSGRQLTDMNWVSRLQSALNEQRILIFGQQIWDLSDRSGRHLEVLISLRDVDGSLVSPVEFIPAAERYGLMPAIDHYVMDAVFRHIRPLQPQLIKANYRVAINLSGHTIGSDAALNEIRKLFNRYAIEPSLICFEITETAALQSMSDAQRFLLALKKLGCQLALDDFGTGFSSFSYLKSLPVDMLKIDGEFVREMLHKETDYAIVEGIHRVGVTMGLKTVAECVENADILRELKAIGVDYGQGMFLSERRPLKEIISKQTLSIGD